MCKKLSILFVAFLYVSITALAQREVKKALVKGKLQNQANGQPANDVQITIPYLRMLTISDGVGDFTFSQVSYGNHTIIIGSTNTKPDTLKIFVNREVVDLGILNVISNDAASAMQSFQIPIIALEENYNDDDGDAQNVSGLLTASRDPFINTAAFIFGNYRFQARGYDRNQQQILINGAPMNDVETGDAYWSQWGGLNDVFRGSSSAYGLQPSEYAFGGINGATYLDATAANQRKQTRFSYSLSNRQYNNRLMFTHSSGLLKSGWAYSLSFSKRWAKEGYIDGTFYDGYSYYAAVSKKIGSKHEINLTTFGAPTKRGKSAPSYQEAYDLVGSNFYNPNWGYLNGEKRNAKVANIFQPVILLNYEYTPSPTLNWNTTIGYQFGKNKNSTLDWYNAADPRADYYRNLPNFYLLDVQPDTSKANAYRNAFINDPQIKWNELYQANYLNKRPIPNADGTPNGDSGRRSVYVIGNDVDDVKKLTFNTTIQKALNDHVILYGGISAITQKTESYREMLDLLGGDFYLNVNSFSERNNAGSTTLNQYDIYNPNRVIKEGDKYYYHYNVRFLKSWLWAQAAFTYNKVDLFISGNYGINNFQREGFYRNGLYANGNESFGKSEKQNFNIYGVKAGVTYKINGRHYLFINAAYTADAPSADNTFPVARVRNITANDPVTQKIYAAEGGYLLHAPNVNVRVVGYATDVKDKVELQRFYLQGTGSANTFVSYLMQGLNTRSIGTELALDYKISSSLSVTAVAAIGQSFYTNNPKVSIYEENTTNLIPDTTEKTYIKNYYLGVGPQSAYTLALSYRSKNYWYATVNFNYFDRNYIDIAAPRRNTESVDLLEPGSQQWHDVLDQEKLPAIFTIDAFVYKSFLFSKIYKKLPRNTYLYFSLGISNLLNNKSVATGGFENPRFDYEGGFANKFAPKYFYGYGRNYFVNWSLKF